MSQKKVCARLGIDEKRLYRIIAKLEAKGFVRNLGGRLSGDMRERGTLFDVQLPEVTRAPPTGAAPAARPVPAASRAPAAGRPPIMKESSKEEGKPPDKFEIREVAARLHHRFPSDSHDERVERVLGAFVAQGREVERDEIEAAVAGLAL